MSEEKEKKQSSSSSREKESSGSSKGKGYSGKAMLVVALRNKFFFMFYRYSILVFFSSILTLISSVFVLLFFTNQRVPAQYVPVNEDGSYIKLASVKDCESKTEAEVKTFVTNAAKSLFKYDYINYSEQLQNNAQYFTTTGWNEFLDSFKSSGTLTAVLENNYIVTNELLGIAELTREAYNDENDNGACTWELKVPMLITYVGKNGQKRTIDFYAKVSRVSVIRSEYGLGIKKIVITDGE